MKKRPTRTGPTLRRWILGLGLVLWLVSMVILTCCVASDMVIQLEKELYTYVQSEGSRSHHGDTDLPGTAELNMIDNLGNIYYWVDIDPLLPIVGEQFLTNGVSSKEWLWGKWELYYGYEAAVIYYDGEGQELIRTGDYLAFDYTSPEKWTSQELVSLGKSYVALDRIPGGSERFNNMIYDYPPGDFALDMLLPLLRLTGWFEENEFHPTLIESGDYLSYSGWISDTDKLAELDARGKVEWETMLTAETPVGQDLVTIYAWNLEGYNVKPKSVSVQGRKYNSLADLLHAKFNAEDRHTPFKRNLFDTVMVDFGYHEDVFGEYRIAAAVRCHPLFYAIVRLIWVYVISLGMLSLLLWRMIRRIRLEVSEPMERMVGAIRQGYNITPQSDWAEPSAIEEDFVKTRQTLAENKTEINQLHTALDYARDAEEKRKTLISNITHELKTPLAIIHSYTECLKEDVSPEKREQYLATILDETEKMDGMVLQMLELSRLEAGRVRLASDSFSLLELTRAIAEKLQPMLEERELTLHYDLVREFSITADESRIGQVITNFLTNAQKYASQGGQIRINIFHTQGKAYFQIENTAPHLSEEALTKVWDSFYRADAARNTPGTGLGLALVNSIITLHGGSVSVENTIMEGGQTGIRFGFVLSLT